jgi:hypothetical protein
VHLRLSDDHGWQKTISVDLIGPDHSGDAPSGAAPTQEHKP